MSNSRLVYSTDLGRVCPRCGKPVAGCVCRKRLAPPASDGIVRVRRETKGHAGKTVTAIAGLSLGEAQLRELAAELKRHCGTGGAVRDGLILIQGDHCVQVIALLQSQGYMVKRAGG